MAADRQAGANPRTKKIKALTPLPGNPGRASWNFPKDLMMSEMLDRKAPPHLALEANWQMVMAGCKGAIRPPVFRKRCAPSKTGSLGRNSDPSEESVSPEKKSDGTVPTSRCLKGGRDSDSQEDLVLIQRWPVSRMNRVRCCDSSCLRSSIHLALRSVRKSKISGVPNKKLFLILNTSLRRLSCAQKIPTILCLLDKRC